MPSHPTQPSLLCGPCRALAEGGWEARWETDFRRTSAMARLQALDEELEEDGDVDDAEDEEYAEDALGAAPGGAWTLGTDKLRLFGDGEGGSLAPRDVAVAIGGRRLVLVRLPTAVTCIRTRTDTHYSAPPTYAIPYLVPRWRVRWLLCSWPRTLVARGGVR